MRKSNFRPAMNSGAAYAACRAEIAQLVAKLDTKLDAHGAAHAKRPRDWGYVGDLEHIAELLRRAVGEEEA